MGRGNIFIKMKKEVENVGLQQGDIAPDFVLPSTDKHDISLSDYKGKKNVLIVFFPLDFTPG